MHTDREIHFNSLFEKHLFLISLLNAETYEL